MSKPTTKQDKKYYRLHLINRIKKVLHNGKGDTLLHSKFFRLDKTRLLKRKLISHAIK